MVSISNKGPEFRHAVFRCHSVAPQFAHVTIQWDVVRKVGGKSLQIQILDQANFDLYSASKPFKCLNDNCFERDPKITHGQVGASDSPAYYIIMSAAEDTLLSFTVQEAYILISRSLSIQILKDPDVRPQSFEDLQEDVNFIWSAKLLKSVQRSKERIASKNSFASAGAAMSKVVPSLEGVNEGMKTYSLADVSQHCTPEDCWVIIHGFVYNVSKYLDKHPGGPNLVMKNAGGDATAAFEAMYHSARARGILEELKIGELDEKSKNSAGSLLTPFSAGVARPGMAKGSGPYGLGAYDPKKPLLRLAPMQQTPQRPPIDEIAWRRYELLSIVKVNHDTSIFRFQIPHKARLNSGMGKHLSLGLTINGKMTKRDYTPISDEPGYFELMIKKYENGPISSHIHGLKIGDGANMRGVYGTLQVKPDKWSHLFMFSAGTGIAPMIPFIRYFASTARKEAEMKSSADSSTPSVQIPKVAKQIHLLFANKTEEDILLRMELEKCVQLGNGTFTIDYLLSRTKEHEKSSESHENQTYSNGADMMQVDGEIKTTASVPSIATHYGRISDQHMEIMHSRAPEAFRNSKDGPIESAFALVCGPDGFVDTVKGMLQDQWHYAEHHYHPF